MPKITMNTTALVTEFGNYYQDRGQGQNDVIRMYSQADETTAVFDDVFTTDDQKVTKVSVSGGRIVQAFQKAFTPIGSTLNFKVHPIELYQFKIDEQIDPDEIVRTWLGFWEGLPEVERKNWPLIKWLINVHFKEQTAEDIELNEIFRGEFLEPTAGTANAAGRNMNGIRKVINDHISAGRIAPLAMSVAVPPTDPADFVEWCTEFTRKIDPKVVAKVSHLNMSPELGDRFIDGMDLKNANFNKEPDLLKIPKSHIRIRGVQTQNGGFKLGLRSHSGSNKVWATVPKNAALIRRNGRTSDKFEAQADKRTVNLMADWWFGQGFWVPQWVFTNAADLTTLYPPA